MKEWTDRLPEETLGLVSICASEVAIEQVDWLWPGRLAVGKHTCIAGEPGAGKSQLTMHIAATVTTGGTWPCDEGRAKQGSVIILSAEDGAADTIVPRLHASGADLGSINIISAVKDIEGRRSFNLQRDLALLEEKVRGIGNVALIIIDPVSSYLGKTDSHKNAEVRGVLEPIGEFAERMRVAVLSVTHFSKAGAGTTTKALHRFIGSIAFVGAPRIALAVIEDADNDRRLLLHAKNNLALPPQGLAYRIKEKIVGEPGRSVTAPYAVFDAEHVTMTANDAMDADSGRTRDGHAVDEAEDFLRELLSDGPVSSKQARSDAEGAGLSWSTVKRAKTNLGIKAEKSGMAGGWAWALPPKGTNYSEEAHVTFGEPLPEIRHSCEPLPENPKGTNRNGRKPEGDHILDVSPFGADEPLRDNDPFAGLKDKSLALPPDPFDLDAIPECCERRKSRLDRRATRA